MTDKHFNAILAKNYIAEEIAQCEKLQDLSIKYIVSCLEDIEAYTGQGNQPSIEDILKN